MTFDAGYPDYGHLRLTTIMTKVLTKYRLGPLNHRKSSMGCARDDTGDAKRDQSRDQCADRLRYPRISITRESDIIADS